MAEPEAPHDDSTPEVLPLAPPMPEVHEAAAAPPVRPGMGVWHGIGLLVLFYACVLVAGVAAGAAGMRLEGSGFILLSQAVAWPVTVWATARLAKGTWRWSELLAPVPGVAAVAFVFASAGIALLCVALAGLIPMPEEIRKGFEKALAGDPLTVFLTLVIVAPIAEELCFRGFLLRGLLARSSAAKAVASSSVLFAVFHLNPWQAVTGVVTGVLFAWAALRSGSLVLPVLGHMTVNGTVSILLGPILGLLGHSEAEVEAMTSLPGGLMAGASVVAAAGLLVAAKTLPRTPLGEVAPGSGPSGSVAG
ncbi:MAG: CPBP family intramembrane metalloprotease [Planctomycetes bacterium]|nr:CPBP family intramembrane metalloprotease [Planctomycetota bacterium]